MMRFPPNFYLKKDGTESRGEEEEEKKVFYYAEGGFFPFENASPGSISPSKEIHS